MKVVFLHPDLGIGGAERLVVDAAVALQKRGHSVCFVTNHHDRSHCFPETLTIDVTVVGDWIPRHVFGKLNALCAYIRMIYAAFYLIMCSSILYDVIICDQISACIPVLRIKKTKILFYCHFPDQLLTQRHSFLKKLYRAPLDWLEQSTTGMADVILVNSRFTGKVFKDTFTRLSNRDPQVLYPSLDFEQFDKFKDDSPMKDQFPPSRKCIFLSINRYEYKKDLALAIRALSQVKSQVSATQWQGVHLIVAGGYDERLPWNREYYLELNKLAEELDVKEHVTFLRSISDNQKMSLLRACSCLLYTPANEHFGIVPLEAMYCGRPVIAQNSGGPLETVLTGKTGFLSPADEFASSMVRFVQDDKLSQKLGEAGRKHVQDKFSFAAFSATLDKVLSKLVKQ